jgi:hypothetical protein
MLKGAATPVFRFTGGRLINPPTARTTERCDDGVD